MYKKLNGDIGSILIVCNVKFIWCSFWLYVGILCVVICGNGNRFFGYFDYVFFCLVKVSVFRFEVIFI